MNISQTLWISDQIFKRMLDEAEKWMPYETGGVFMGYQAENNDLVVTDLIDAGAKATHSYSKFDPDQGYQLEEIALKFVNTDGAITYLGDWHTHPNSKPELSRLDKRTLTKIALTPESRNTQPVMVILGGRPEKWIWSTVQFVSGAMWPWPFSKCNYNKIRHEIYRE